MEIFCVKCQKKVGQIADEKIPTGKKMSVSCPECREKIHFVKPVDFSTEAILQEEVSAPQTTYDFNIMDIIREAWAKTSGTKGPIWGAIALAVLAIMVFSGVVAAVSAIIGSGSAAAALGVAAQLTFTVASYPFVAGLLLIGICRSVDRPVDFKMAFSCFGYILPIVIATFLKSILSIIGFLLLIIPGIYLSIAYLLVIPLIFDKEMGPWQAMEASRKAIQQHWFKVFGLCFLMAFICVLSFIPLGLGLIWTVPMAFMVSGILYREIFGVSQET
jgi:DNA-directed RNA polymerase subunit RPC12/RpoP